MKCMFGSPISHRAQQPADIPIRHRGSFMFWKERSSWKWMASRPRRSRRAKRLLSLLMRYTTSEMRVPRSRPRRWVFNTPGKVKLFKSTPPEINQAHPRGGQCLQLTKRTWRDVCLPVRLWHEAADCSVMVRPVAFGRSGHVPQCGSDRLTQLRHGPDQIPHQPAILRYFLGAEIFAKDGRST
jgi:hypothetical protein